MASELLGDLLVKIRGDLSDLEKSINSAEGQSSQAAGKIEKDFSKSFTKIANDAQKIGKSLSTFVTLPILGAAAAAVKLGSDTGESLNAANVVFKESANIIEAWGKESVKQAGLTAAEFYQASAVIGAGLTNAGASSEQAAEQTIELTKRAADMASIFNTDVNDALIALQSGLRGESEPLRRFAVSLDEASVKAKAVELGLVDAEGEVTAYGKSQARLALIMEQSSKFQGDFVNTSDQLANGTRVTTALVKEQVAEFGERLLPVVLDLVQGVGKFADMLSNLTDTQRDNILVVAGFAAATGPAISGISALTKAVLALNAGLTINPIVAATVALVAIGAATAVIVNNFKEAKKEKEELDKVLSGGSSGNYADDLKLINERLEKATKEMQRKNAMVEAGNTYEATALKQLKEEVDLLNSTKAELAEKLKWQALNQRGQEEMNRQVTAESVAQEDINEALKIREAVTEKYLSAREKVKSVIEGERTEYEKIEDQINELEKTPWAKGELENDRLKAIEILRARQEELVRQEQEDDKQRISEAAATEAAIDKERQKAHGAYIQMQIDKREADRETQESFAELNRTTVENEIDEIYRKRDAFIDAGVKEVKANEWAQKEILKKQLTTISTIIGGIGNLVSKLNSLYQMDYTNRVDRLDAATEKQLSDLDKEYKAKKIGVEDTTALDKQYEIDKKAIEKDAALDKYRLQKEAFLVNQKISLTEASISAAQGAIAAYQALAGIPFVGPALGIAAAAAILAYGEVQKGYIRDQVPPQPPSFSEGGWGNKPTVAQVFDNPTYPEFVAPLSPEFFDNLANGMMSAMSRRSNVSSGYSQGLAMSGGNNGNTIILENTTILDGKLIGENTVKYLDNGKIRSKILSKAVAR